MKYVKISEDLFCDLYLFHVIGSNEPAERIRDGLQQKMDALIRRDEYSKYKTAPTAEEREEARQRYLNSIAMPKDFRW